MRPHCLQTAHKQASETTLFANSPSPILYQRVQSLRSRERPCAWPRRPDGARLSDVTVCGQLSQKGWVVSRDGDARRPCDARECLLRLSLKEAEMGQSILCPPLSGVVRLHGVWVLAVVCGLFAPIVGPFVGNVVLQRFLFALI